jgi:predicted esterase
VPRTVLTLLLLVVLAGPAFAGNPEVKRSEKGMTYSLRVPDGYDRSKGGLLVLALHGRGGKHTEFMDTMKAMAFLKDAIVATPQAPTNATWDAADMAPLSDLIAELQEQWSPARTLCFGFSAGGYFTFTMSLTYPGLIQGAIPCSGGLPLGVPSDEKVKKVPFYVIHGDADGIVNVDQSRSAVKALEGAGVPVKYEEIPAMGHTLNNDAIKRGFEWVEKTLGPMNPELPDSVTGERLKALDKALKAKDWDEATKVFPTLVGATPRWSGKIASLAKPQFSSTSEPLALVAIEECGHLGVDGVSVLKSISPEKETLAKAAAAALARAGVPQAVEPLLTLLKGKSEAVAVEAARELRRTGALGTHALILGLQHVEEKKVDDDRKAMILASLKRMTGQTLATFKEWKRWEQQGDGK